MASTDYRKTSLGSQNNYRKVDIDKLDKLILSIYVDTVVHMINLLSLIASFHNNSLPP